VVIVLRICRVFKMKVPLVCRKYVFSLIGGKTTLLQKLLYIIKEVRLVDGRNEQCTGRQTARDGREDCGRTGLNA